MKKNNKTAAVKSANGGPSSFDVDMLNSLKEIKETSGLTYEQMGRMVNVGWSTLARWFTQGIGKVHKSTRIQVVRFIKEYQEAEKKGKLELFLKGVRE